MRHFTPKRKKLHGPTVTGKMKLVRIDARTQILVSMDTPEEEAREDIDRLLIQAGWAVHDKNAINLWRVVDALDVIVSVNLQRAARHHQSILQRAFSGQLWLP